MLPQPFPNVDPHPSRPSLVYRQRLDNERVIKPEATTEVCPDLIGAPRGANKPYVIERLDAILEGFEGGEEGGLPVEIVEFKRDKVAGHDQSPFHGNGMPR